MADQLQSSIFTRVAKMIWGLKLLLFFVGCTAIVVLLRASVIPYSSDFIFSTLPTLWLSPRFRLYPPLLFIVVNIIIFAILVSSFSQNLSTTPPSDGKIAAADGTSAFEVELPDPDISEDLKMVAEGEEREDEKQMVWNFSVSSDEKVIDAQQEGLREDHLFPDCVESREELVVVDGSLESTWKTILKEQVRLERHLKKSQTVGILTRNLRRDRTHAVYGGGDNEDQEAWNKRGLTKSDTFDGSVSYLREKPMSHDELKRRSEAFINRVNADMRLQRLESAHRFLLRHG